MPVTETPLECRKAAVSWQILPADATPCRNKSTQLLRKLHLWLGVLFTVNFFIILVTGFLVQHRDVFRLESRAISRRWLSAAYRPNDPDSEIRADIVITDLHSGKLLGRRGPLLIDGAAIAWALMMGSGYGMQVVSRFRNHQST